MFKQLFFYLSLIVIICSTTISITSAEKDVASPFVMVGEGNVPTIDGNISENEWSDASVIDLGDDAHIYLKHDAVNLYIATDSKVGNVFFVFDNKMYVFHASYSLGLAVYRHDDIHQLWACSKQYFWEMRVNYVRNASRDELKSRINCYMMENGWVASTVPMAKEEHNEMAISFNRLGLNPIRDNMNKKITLSPILIGHDTFRWPITYQASALINSLIGGGCPDIIDLDYSNWGSIILDFR